LSAGGLRRRNGDNAWAASLGRCGLFPHGASFSIPQGFGLNRFDAPSIGVKSSEPVPGGVSFCTRIVTLIDEDTGEKRKWRIVGEPEANASKGTISVASPIARALIGKKKGATIEVMAPSGAKVYKVLRVEWR
jgi:hypothetical protein